MKHKNKDYKNYNLEDFICDESFTEFAKKSNQIDINKWEAWIAENPQKKAIAAEAKLLIQHLRFNKQELPTDFVSEEWFKLSKRLKLEDRPPLVKTKSIFSRLAPYAAAASILLFLFSAVYFLNVKPKEEIIIAFNEIIVPKGEIQRVILPDSSLVYINSDSKLSYAQNFGEKTREVYLEGEAWFDVKHNPKKAFVVHSGENDIKVLGTAFNVYAYPDENIFRASLERGKISISHKNEKITDLNVDQSFTFYKDSKQFEITTSKNIQMCSSWVNGRTVFCNQSFNEILRKLGRSHNVVFDLQNEQVGKCKYTGVFSIEDDIETILGVIKLPTAFEYVVVNDTIVIK